MKAVTCKRCGGSGVDVDSRAIGQAMRKKRESKGVTMAAIADKLGKTSGYLSDLERGNRRWNDALIARYKEALDE